MTTMPSISMLDWVYLNNTRSQKQSPGGVLQKRPATLLKKRLWHNFIKNETLAQVFSREFCKISKNTFSYRTPLVTASRSLKLEL